jgi:hypothetical protein
MEFSVFIPYVPLIAVTAAIISAAVALLEYGLKVNAERRLTKSTKIESDIKLIKLFTEIMDIAHGRRGSYVSEKAVEMLLPFEIEEASEFLVSDIKGTLEKAVINLPVGLAAQNAAIRSIYELGKEHQILKPIAIQGLENLNEFKKDIVSPLLDDLKSN